MKRFISVLLTVALVFAMAIPVFADENANLNFTPNISAIGTTKAKSVADSVLGIIQFFGYAVAVGMLLYIGIKYMMASAQDKADLKKGSIYYVIGAVLLVGASAIVGIFRDFGETINK